jgi:predicted secreted protein
MPPISLLSVTKGSVPVALLSAAFLVGFTPIAQPASAASAAKVYTHADSGDTVHVASGTKFKVRLKVCETCGYRWSFANHPRKSVLRLEHKSDVSSAKPPAVGGINTVTWTYQAVHAGKTTMKLVERSPAGKVAKHFRLTVKAHSRLVSAD